LDESRRAELEAEMKRLFDIEKQNNEEAKKYRHKIRYRLAYDEYEDKTYRDQVEKLQDSADEAGNKAREIQKQLESIDTPPEQLITDTVQNTLSGAETEATGSQTTSTEQHGSEGAAFIHREGKVRTDTLDTDVEVQPGPVGESAITSKPSESDTNETAADSIGHPERSDAMDNGQTKEKQPSEELDDPADRTTETKDQTETMGASDTDLGDDKPISKPETDRPIYIGEIPNDVLRDAVEKMACGWKRIDVAKELMAQDPLPEWLRSISDMGVLSDKEKTDADNLLSQKLRVADHKSDKFSRTRFQEHYEAALDGARLALRDRIHKLVLAEVEALEKAALDYQRLYDDVKCKVDAASENPEQWDRNTKLMLRIHRERTTNVDKPLAHLSNLLNALISLEKAE